MDQIKNQLDELVRRLDRRISQASSRSNRFALLTLALLFVALLVIAVFANRYIMTINNRLHDLQTTVASRSASEQTQQSQPASSEAVISLDKRITSLENLQEAMTSTSRGALEQMNYVFTIVAAFFGLFALFFAYRQAKADTTREEHDEEMRGLVASFQQNITTISSLISTLEQSYDYRKQIEAQLNLISERAKVLESHKAEGEANILNLIYELNEEAVKLFPADIDRANLGLEENRRKMEDFANKLTGLERIRKVEDVLNPFCYYIRGLS
jgi:flagellar biosynthesis/type III secretory pathway M-ring protein FliF/YscJ